MRFSSSCCCCCVFGTLGCERARALEHISYCIWFRICGKTRAKAICTPFVRCAVCARSVRRPSPFSRVPPLALARQYAPLPLYRVSAGCKSVQRRSLLIPKTHTSTTLITRRVRLPHKLRVLYYEYYDKKVVVVVGGEEGAVRVCVCVCVG